MHVTLSVVGKLKPSPLKSLYDEYLRRLEWKVSLCEHTSASSREREGQVLLGAAPSPCFLVALDERGEALSSQGFTSLLSDIQLHHQGRVAFLIGGADGLSQEVREKANRIISFGAMTWPHLMARVLLVEQLYRAQQILKGHPYHRG